VKPETIVVCVKIVRSRRGEPTVLEEGKLPHHVRNLFRLRRQVLLNQYRQVLLLSRALLRLHVAATWVEQQSYVELRPKRWKISKTSPLNVSRQGVRKTIAEHE
jgi:hypothetical protein